MAACRCPGGLHHHRRGQPPTGAQRPRALLEEHVPGGCNATALFLGRRRDGHRLRRQSPPEGVQPAVRLESGEHTEQHHPPRSAAGGLCYRMRPASQCRGHVRRQRLCLGPRRAAARPAGGRRHRLGPGPREVPRNGARPAAAPRALLWPGRAERLGDVTSLRRRHLRRARCGPGRRVAHGDPVLDAPPARRRLRGSWRGAAGGRRRRSRRAAAPAGAAAVPEGAPQHQLQRCPDL
mmetsp:Transcript_102305/g.305480  ORF Transcript_102305/g.305480 Transcript_102305/m.305480 type:complete len:236 (+) Transcript_102305:886-1593(+)